MTNSLLLNIAEIVGFPRQKWWIFPVCYIKLPEGKTCKAPMNGDKLESGYLKLVETSAKWSSLDG